jgi:hypothetical protein
MARAAGDGVVRRCRWRHGPLAGCAPEHVRFRTAHVRLFGARQRQRRATGQETAAARHCDCGHLLWMVPLHLGPGLQAIATVEQYICERYCASRRVYLQGRPCLAHGPARLIPGWRKSRFFLSVHADRGALSRRRYGRSRGWSRSRGGRGCPRVILCVSRSFYSASSLLCRLGKCFRLVYVLRRVGIFGRFLVCGGWRRGLLISLVCPVHLASLRRIVQRTRFGLLVHLPGLRAGLRIRLVCSVHLARLRLAQHIVERDHSALIGTSCSPATNGANNRHVLPF